MSVNFNCRFIARLIVEAQTPLFVGSGDASLMTDALVVKDHNGLPMIPGTSLAGVLRHALEDFDDDPTYWNDIFGFQRKNEKIGLGSRLQISSAYLLMGDQKIVESTGHSIDPVLETKLSNLPSRQHVRINKNGVADKNGLFDNEVVFKGARFIFEVELKGTTKDDTFWDKIINAFNSPLFRIGQGTRNGYGKLSIYKIFNKSFNLDEKVDFNEYIDFNPSFNSIVKMVTPASQENNEEIIAYKLTLKPDDFFIFSEGFGDDEADNRPLTEEVMEYINGKISFVEKTVIPASSLKGALAHRVCFHYNKLQKKYVDNKEGTTGNSNDAVYELFGAEEGAKGRDGLRGNVIIDDLYYDDIDNSKIFNHVAIDRFTGGAMDGALFSEKVSSKRNGEICFDVFVTRSDYPQNIIKALENALIDICKGLLPLGGMTTKGNGMFTGDLLRDNTKIFSYTENLEHATN